MPNEFNIFLIYYYNLLFNSELNIYLKVCNFNSYKEHQLLIMCLIFLNYLIIET